VGTSFGKKNFREYPIDQISKHVKKALSHIRTPSIFNSGELSDSIPSHPNVRLLMDLFETQNRHRLLLLTKSTNVSSLVLGAQSGRRQQSIYSCTVNAYSVAKRWELEAPNPYDRIKALKKVINAGMEGRCRIDPVVPIAGWHQKYDDIVDRIIDASPKRVTIGTTRGLTRTLNFGRKLGYDMSWAEYLSVSTRWGKKICDETRREIYGRLIDRLRSGGIVEIGICKETVEMAKEFDMDRDMKCNCAW
jgi:DNA repair photolyase